MIQTLKMKHKLMKHTWAVKPVLNQRRKNYKAFKAGKKDMGRSVSTKVPVMGLLSKARSIHKLLPMQVQQYFWML